MTLLYNICIFYLRGNCSFMVWFTGRKSVVKNVKIIPVVSHILKKQSGAVTSIPSKWDHRFKSRTLSGREGFQITGLCHHRGPSAVSAGSQVILYWISSSLINRIMGWNGLRDLQEDTEAQRHFSKLYTHIMSSSRRTSKWKHEINQKSCNWSFYIFIWFCKILWSTLQIGLKIEIEAARSRVHYVHVGVCLCVRVCVPTAGPTAIWVRERVIQ